jgi:hypothetical protein
MRSFCISEDTRRAADSEISAGISFFSIWGRIRPIGSALREAAGEKF